MPKSKKIAVISGSYKGIGREIAQQLAEHGNIEPVITARDANQARAVALEMRKAGLIVHHHPLDVTAAESVTPFTQWLSAEHGRVDILVNNAGIFPDNYDESIVSASIDAIANTVAVNALGSLRLCQALLPLLRTTESGRIVNVTSETSSLNGTPIDPLPSAPSYRISKAALNMISQLLAKELADSGILVNSYSPGWVSTDMGGPNAPVTPAEAARTAVWLATLPNNGPHGRFFGEMRWTGTPVELPW